MMKDQSKKKQVLIQELVSLRERIAELEQSESARKRAEEALKKSEALHREAQATAHIGHWELDTSIMKPAWSEEIFHIFGLDPEESEPSFEAHQNVTHPDDWGILNNAVTTSIAEGIPFDIEFRILLPDKTIRWLHAIGYPKKDSEGRIISVFGTAQDITDSKLMEDTLEASEENFRHTMDDSPLGVRIVTIEGETIYANRAILDIYGYDSIEELKTNPVVKRYTPESFAEYQIRREKRKRGDDTPSEYDISIVRKDGEVRHLHAFRKEVLWDGERQFQVLYNDITERKRVEDILRERDIQLKKLSFWVPGMIYEFTKRPDGTYCVPFTTEAIKDVFGCSPQDVREDFSPIARVILPEDFDRVVGSIEYSAKHLTIWTCEYRVQIPGQSIRWMLGNSAPEKLADGSITWYGFNADITERKQKEEALNVSEQKYSILMENASDSILLANAQGNIIEANRRAEGLWGYTKEELSQMHYTQLHPISEVERTIAAFEAMSKKDIDHLNEGFIQRKDGDIVPVDITSSVIIHAGQKVIQGLFRDISEHKQAEEELKASHQQLHAFAGRLQSVREEQRKEFAREIHDELGGALTGLKIDLSFLASSAPKSRDKTKRDSFLSKMLDMSKLIDETIGTVRRLVAQLRPSILDDFGLFAALEWQLQEFQKRTGIQSEFISSMEYINLDEELSIAVFRIFQEALTNAARHANATKVTATLYKEADSLVLKVEDNGRGISADDIHNTKSIGLIGMRERALFLGGKINFSGEPSKGTTISVRFPYRS